MVNHPKLLWSKSKYKKQECIEVSDMMNLVKNANKNVIIPQKLIFSCECHLIKR